jgi:hypothetical protein
MSIMQPDFWQLAELFKSYKFFVHYRDHMKRMVDDYNRKKKGKGLNA